jgi:hypothetical protein
MKLVRLVKMCFNETYSKVSAGKNLSEDFPLQNSLEQGDAFITIAFQFCFRIHNQECPRKQKGTGTEWDISASCRHVNLLSENTNITKESTEVLLSASKGVGQRSKLKEHVVSQDYLTEPLYKNI